MTREIECEGAPRDLGSDQGRACLSALGATFRSQSRWRRARLHVRDESSTCRRVRREIRRFHPQQAEMIDAMARAARVPAAWLVALLVDRQRAASAADEMLLAAASAITDCGGLLARVIPGDAIVRRIRPESGFRSIELTQSWRTAPLAGVNESGLAVACVSGSGASAASQHSAPATLLALDCLRRFENLDAAIDWLLVRPGGGRSMFVLADAAGEVAGVSVDGDDRRVVRPPDGLIVHTGGHARQGEIEKGLREASPLLASDLARFLGMPLVVVEPGRRSIDLLSPKSTRDANRWFEV